MQFGGARLPCTWESAWEENLSWDFAFKKKKVSFTFMLEDLAGVEFEAGNDFSSVLKAWLSCECPVM